MKKNPSRIYFLFFFIVYAFGFHLFYLTYVPLVTSFQLVLVPLLLLVFGLTVADFEKGTLFFIFCFPLINSLPYFFHIYGNIPHAPTCLVLFLAYFFGWLGHRLLEPASLKQKPPLIRPMALFLSLCFVSSVITFFRYAYFFPFKTDRIYELTTNLFGVSSGGAIMSVVFNFLSYFTGFVFFFLLIGRKPSRPFVIKMMLVLAVSTLISLSVGMVQRFGDIKFGNNLISIRHGILNGTFKDALSFGAFISMTLPLLLGLFLYLKNLWRIVLAGNIILSIFLLFFTGSKSALLSLFVALLLFLRLIIPVYRKRKKRPVSQNGKKVRTYAIFALVFLAMGLVFMIFLGNLSRSSLVSRLVEMFDQGVMNLMVSWRGPLWQSAVLMWTDYPLTGVGVGGYIIELPEYLKQHGFPLETPQSAENYLIQVGSETGMIGAVLILWLFICLLGRIRKGYKALPVMGDDAFLWTGAAAGIFSFFMNSLFHTYIGSYEIKLTLWLLLVLIFFLGPEYGIPSGKRLFGKSYLVIGIIFLIVYGIVHTRNSLGPLSLETKAEKYHLKQDFGFYQLERTDTGEPFRWTKDRAGLSVEIKKKTMIFRLHASHPDIKSRPVSVKIFLIKNFFSEKVLLKELNLSDDSWCSIEINMRQEVRKTHIILFEVGRTWNPQKEKGVPDPRNLGIAVGDIRFTGRSVRH
ncbi:MAG: O-antigen ligase family protein [Candidatus Aminicenantes bacterium]|nr:O-antigen ligase family protein [Candidatus Aminicenantes bacterium]